MKKFIILFCFIALGSQAQISDALLQDTIDLWIVPNMAKSITAAKLNTILTWLNTNKINKDSLAVTSISGDTLFIDYAGDHDTLVISGTNYWTLDGSDNISNNNAGNVTLNGQVFVPDITASGAKYSGNVAGIGNDDRLFPKSIIDLYDEIIDTLKYLNRNFANYASVKDYGAVGDGLTDDTQAFQNAIDSNSTVFVPKGVYILSGIDLYTGTQLIGENRDSSILKLETTPTDALITIDNAKEWTTGVSIQNLTLMHRNSYSPSSYYGTLIRMDSVTHISINHCTLKEFSNFGILITNSGSTGDNVLSVDIDNNLFYNADASAIKLSTEGEYVAIRTNRFNEIRAAALYSDGAGNTLFTGNMANHCGSSSYYVVDVRYAYTQANGGKVNITNNNFNHDISGSKGSIGYIMNASTVNMSYFGAIIANNNFLGIVADSAIVTLKASDCIVSNNLFWAVNAGTECIWIADYSGTQLSAHNVITGNINLNSTVFCRNTSTTGAQIINNNYDRSQTTDYGLQSDQTGNWAIGAVVDPAYKFKVNGTIGADSIFIGGGGVLTGALTIPKLLLTDSLNFASTPYITTVSNNDLNINTGTGNVVCTGGLEVTGDIVDIDTKVTAGYTIPIYTGSLSPSDATTYYWGPIAGVTPSTTAGERKIYIPESGNIKSIYISTYSTTAGSNEDWPIYIRLNNTTDYGIDTVALNTNLRQWINTGLNIAVTAGDYIEIKTVTPSWATNPVTMVQGGYLYIEQ